MFKLTCFYIINILIEKLIKDNIFFPTDDAECPEIHSGDIVTDRKSKFQGHIAKITKLSEVQLYVI